MHRNITIKVPEEVARWARRKAADEDTSLSRMVGGLLEREMKRNQDYWKAYRRWAKLGAVPGADASRRARREEVYGARR